MTSKRIPTCLAALFALGLVTVASAATTPVAIWKGNFTSTDLQRGGATLGLNGNTPANGVVPLTKPLKLDTGLSNNQIAAVVRFKDDQTRSADGTIISLGTSSSNPRVSCGFNSSLELYLGWVANYTWGDVKSNYVTGSDSQSWGYGYASPNSGNGDGGYRGSWVVKNGAKVTNSSGLIGSGDVISQIVFGGVSGDTRCLTGAEISMVALFSAAISGDELNKWTAVPVATLTADKHVEISTDTTVSTSVTPLTVEVKQASKLTFSSDVMLTTLGGFFANATTTFDCTALSAETVLVSGSIYGKDNIDIDGSTLPSGMTLTVSDNQIKLVNSYVNYTAEITGDVSWSAKTGLINPNPAEYVDASASTITLTNNQSDEKTLTFDKAVTAASLAIAGSGATVIDKGSDITPSIAAYDFSGAAGTVTLSYAGAGATIAAGADTHITGTGFGAATVAEGKTLVINGDNVGAVSSVTGAGTVKYVATTTAQKLTYTPATYLSGFTGTMWIGAGCFTVDGTYPNAVSAKVTNGGQLYYTGGGVFGAGLTISGGGYTGESGALGESALRLENGKTYTGTLTLEAETGYPSVGICVYNGTATLNGALAGSAGMIKRGDGTMTLGSGFSHSGFTGAIEVREGTLGLGGKRLEDNVITGAGTVTATLTDDERTTLVGGEAVKLFKLDGEALPSGLAITVTDSALRTYTPVAENGYCVVKLTQHAATATGAIGWNDLTWDTAITSADKACANITVSGSATLDMADAPSNLARLVASGGTLTLKWSDVDGTNLCKNAVVGAPSTSPFVPTAFGGTYQVECPKIAKGYSIASEELDGHGLRFIVRATGGFRFGSININLYHATDGQKVADSADYNTVDYGAFPIVGSSWNDILANSATTYSTLDVVAADGTKSSQSVSFQLHQSRQHRTGASNCNRLLYGYQDDSNTGLANAYTIGSIPFEKYRIIVHYATDSNAGFGFAGAKIGTDSSATTYYYGPSWNDTDGGVTISGTTAQDWGYSQTRDTLKEGVNYIVSDVLTGGSAYISAARSNNGGGKARACVAAIQIVEVGQLGDGTRYDKWGYAPIFTWETTADEVDFTGASSVFYQFDTNTWTDTGSSLCGTTQYNGQDFWKSWAFTTSQAGYAEPGLVWRFKPGSYGQTIKCSMGPLTFGGMIAEEDSADYTFYNADGNSRSTLFGDPTGKTPTYFKLDSNVKIKRSSSNSGAVCYIGLAGRIELDIAEDKWLDLNSEVEDDKGSATLYGTIEKAASGNFGTTTAGGELVMKGEGTLKARKLTANGSTLDFSNLSKTHTYLATALAIDENTVLKLPEGLAADEAYTLCTGTLTAPTGPVNVETLEVGSNTIQKATLTYNTANKTVTWNYNGYVEPITATVAEGTNDWSKQTWKDANGRSVPALELSNYAYTLTPASGATKACVLKLDMNVVYTNVTLGGAITFDVPLDQTLTLDQRPGSNLTITGAGVVERPITTLENPNWNWDSDWTGTYRVTVTPDEGIAAIAWDPTSWYNGMSSKMEFVGNVTNGYFRSTGFDVGELILTGSILFTDGYTKSGDTQNVYSFTKLSGAGSFSGNVVNPYPIIWFKDVDAFTGSISTAGSNGYRFVLGNGELTGTSDIYPGKKTITILGAVDLHAALTAAGGVIVGPSGTLKVNSWPVTSSTLTLNGTLDANGHSITNFALAGGTLIDTADVKGAFVYTADRVLTGTIGTGATLVADRGTVNLSGAKVNEGAILKTKATYANFGRPFVLPGGVSYDRVTIDGEVESGLTYDSTTGRIGFAAKVSRLTWLPVGDSITEGEAKMGHPMEGDANTRGGYRYSLWNMLDGSGQLTTSVGFRSGHNGTVETGVDWAWHGAIYGGVISPLSAGGNKYGAHLFNVESFLEVAGYPDVISIMIGINDLSFLSNTPSDPCTEGVEDVFQTWVKLVDKYAKLRPHSKILATTVLPVGDGNKSYLRFDPFNGKIRTAATNKAAPFDNANVIFADVALEAFNNAYDAKYWKSGDLVHPNEEGARIVAAAFVKTGFKTAIEQIVSDSVKVAQIHNGKTGKVTARLSKAISSCTSATLAIDGTDIAGGTLDLDLTDGTLSSDGKTIDFTYANALTNLTTATATLTVDGTGYASDANTDFDITGSGAAENVKAAYLADAGFQKFQTIVIENGTEEKGAETITTNDEDLAGIAIGKVGYYVELKRADEPAQFVWVSMAASPFDFTSDKVGLPSAEVGTIKATAGLGTVFGNRGNFTNEVTGTDVIVEFTPHAYTEANQNGYADEASTAAVFGWNDTLADSDDFGCMQVARVTGNARTRCDAAGEMLFAYNGFKSDNANDIGIGSLSTHRNNAGGSIDAVYDWTYMTAHGDLEKFKLAAYVVKKIEVWVAPTYEYRAAVGENKAWSAIAWTPAAGGNPVSSEDLPAGATLTLDVSGAVTVTIDAAIDVADLIVTNSTVTASSITLVNTSGIGRFDFAPTLTGVNVDGVWSEPYEIPAGQTFTLNVKADYTLSAVLSGVGKFVKAGTGTLTLSSVNTFTGGAELQGGILKMGNDKALSSGTIIVRNGTTLDFNGKYPSGDIHIAGTGSIGQGAIVSSSNMGSDKLYKLYLDGDASMGGSCNLHWGNSASIYLQGHELTVNMATDGANWYFNNTKVKDTGTITVTHGVFCGSNPATSDMSGVALVLNGGTLDFNQQSLVVSNFTYKSGTVMTGDAGALTVKGTVSADDAVSIEKLTLNSGATVASGNITVSSALTLGDTLNVAIAGAKHGTAIMTVPAAMQNPTAAVTVNGEAGYTLVNDNGALKLYKPAATVFTVTKITEKASTNFNGSTLTVDYAAYEKGDYDSVEVKVSVGGHDYTYTPEELGLLAGGGSFTVPVADDYAKAGTVTGAVVTVVGSGTIKSGAPDVTAYSGTKYLYQGHADAVSTNGWFDVTAARLSADGTWALDEPPTADDRIVFKETDEGVDADYTFTPNAPSATGEVVVVDTKLLFDAPLDANVPDVADALAAFRVVTDAEGTFRFAAVVSGAWVTNMSHEVSMGAQYELRTTLDYRSVPARVSYDLKANDGYQSVTGGIARADAKFLSEVGFEGSGRLAQMVGSNLVDSVDASLVKDAGGNRYADIDAAIAGGVTDMTLLWDASWVLPSGAGEWKVRQGDGYRLYVDPKDGQVVKFEDGVYTVITDYYEAMDLLFGADGVTTNRFMYFTNAVVQVERTATNLYLLRDVELGEALTVSRDIWFNGETNILSGKGLSVASGTFTVQSGCIGIPFAAGVAVTGGRFTESGTNAWKSILTDATTFAELAAPVRPGYQWQLVAKSAAPEEGEVLMPVTDANGESVSVVVSNEWVSAVTKSADPAEQSQKLSTVQGNGLTYLDNAILGLAASAEAEVEAGNIPVIQPVQSANASQVTFSLGNVSFQSITNSGARVKYRVYSSTRPGGKDGAVSEEAEPADEVQMGLPTGDDKVLYYIIEVDNGSVK